MTQHIKAKFNVNFVTTGGFLFFIFTACFSFWLGDLWRPYNYLKGHSNFVWDMFGYYSYLPSTFLNHGSFQFNETVQNFNPQLPNGQFMPKYTYGLAILQLPFFLLAMLFEKLQGNVGTGFSNYYCVFQEVGTLVYVLVGLYLLRKVLLCYYREFSTTVALFVIVFGTILFMYTFVQAQMPHAYLFFLVSVLIYFTSEYYQTQRLKYIWFSAFAWALIVLIRPTEIVFFFFFLFWQVYDFKQAKERVLAFVSNYKLVLPFAFALGLVWLPQLIFWKKFTGTYFFDSYVNEQFFWLDPQLLNVWFSYRKGLFVYTPAVLLSVIGLFIIKKNSPFSAWLYLGIFVLLSYVYSCWWTWDFGGCFGARSFTHHLAYLIFPLSALIDKVNDATKTFVLQRLAVLALYTACFSVVCLNIGQSYQYQVQRTIDPIGMSKDLYWETFTKYQHNENFQKNFYFKHLHPANADDWRKGINRSDN